MFQPCFANGLCARVAMSDVMVNGEWLVREGRPVKWDEFEVCATAAQSAKDLLERS